MRIYVVGSGAIGSYFGGHLVRDGNDVTFLGRGVHLDALRKQGLSVQTMTDTIRLESVQTIESTSEITKPDLIFFCVKTYSTETVAKTLASVVSDNTTIITLQNGVENDVRVKAFVPNAAVYPGNTLIACRRPEPGVVRQTGGPGKLLFGNPTGGENKQLKTIEQLLLRAGINAVYSDDILRDLWKKFILITAFGGLTALCRAPIGVILTNSASRQLYERCVRETIDVALRRRVRLPHDVFEHVIQSSEAFLDTPQKAASQSSLLVDLESGSETEIETINGTVVRMAEDYGVDVPVNSAIYAGVKLASAD